MLGAMGFPKHYSTRHGEDEGRGHLSNGSMGFPKHKSIRHDEQGTSVVISSLKPMNMVNNSY